MIIIFIFRIYVIVLVILLGHVASILWTQEICALDSEGRVVLTEHTFSEGEQRLVVINVYSPRVDPESCERLPYKLNFFTALRERCRELEQSGRCVLFLVSITVASLVGRPF